MLTVQEQDLLWSLTSETHGAIYQWCVWLADHPKGNWTVETIYVKIPHF